MSKNSGRTAAKSSASERQRLRSGSTDRHRAVIIGMVILVVFAVVVLYLIYQSSQSTHSGATGGSGYRHMAGQPRAGATAPPFTLVSSDGGQVSLVDFRGKSEPDRAEGAG